MILKGMDRGDQKLYNCLAVRGNLYDEKLPWRYAKNTVVIGRTSNFGAGCKSATTAKEILPRGLFTKDF
jgi:hypothetical protein